MHKLTQRQSEVLNLLRQGHRSKEIAQMLYLSPRTVEKHIGVMLQLFGCRNAVQLISFSYENDLLLKTGNPTTDKAA
jgi:DNA-binding NarL/FixJ family response regulator